MPKYLVVGSPGEADRNGDGRISAVELSVSAAHLGLFAAGLLLGFVGLVGSWLAPLGPFRLVLFLLDVALVTACAVGCWRHYAVFDRALRWAAADRQRQHKIEDQERAQMANLRPRPGVGISQGELDAAVRKILRTWAAGKPWGREHVKISEPLWNAANKALKQSGLRAGRAAKIDATDFNVAWAQYIDWQAKDLTLHRSGDDFVYD